MTAGLGEMARVIRTGRQDKVTAWVEVEFPDGARGLLWLPMADAPAVGDFVPADGCIVHGIDAAVRSGRLTATDA